jgi:hypothetical protein
VGTTRIGVLLPTPYYTTRVVGWSIMLCGVLWWVRLRYVVPHVGHNHIGRYLSVTRKLWFHQEDGYKVLEYEAIDFKWPPKEGDEESNEGIEDVKIIAGENEARPHQADRLHAV